MADIDKIAVNNTTYNIKDSTARDSISQMLVNNGAHDLNTLTTTGLYYCYNASTNLPANAYGGGLIVISSGSAAVQFFIENTATPKTYVRRYSNGAWGSWLQV